MMLQKKVDRAMEWLKEKNQAQQQSIDLGNDDGINKELDYYDPRAEWLAEESSNMELEKGDILAIIVSASMVFGPILLILIIILLLILKL